MQAASDLCPSLYLQDVWDQTALSLKAAEEALLKVSDDPATWDFWFRTGGGITGERLLQLLQAVAGLTLSHPDTDVISRIQCNGVRVSIMASLVILVSASDQQGIRVPSSTCFWV